VPGVIVISYLGRLIRAIGVCLSLLAATATAQATRPYQMTILSSTDPGDFYTNAGVDISVFNRGHIQYDLQPPGLSIVWTAVDAKLDDVDSNDYQLIDWSRIVAVYVDEPYGSIVAGKDDCKAQATRAAVDARNLDLSRVADAVRRKASHARFWVNFTPHEIELIVDVNSNCDLNQSYIDVISMDEYGVEFDNTIRNRYDNLYANHRHSPHQQLGLVPGTFTGGYKDQKAEDQARRLRGHLQYAYNMNQRCDLPLGPSRITGIYDRCPVWMVAGWSGGKEDFHEDGYTFRHIDHPASRDVFDAWQSFFSLPKINPSKAPAARALVPLLTVE
jgi:hypothetical protein